MLEKKLHLEKISSILVVRLDRLGDLLCTTPMLSALKVLFPKARLTLVVSPYTAHLVEGSPILDEVLIYPRRKYGGHWPERVSFWYHFLNRSFDLALAPKSNLHPTQALLVWASRAPLRVGRAAKRRRWRRRLLHFCYNILLPIHRPGYHETEACLDLLRALGLNPPRLPSWVIIKSWAQEEVEKRLLTLGLLGKPLWGLYFSNRRQSRSLSWEYLIKLGKCIQKAFPQFLPIVTCSPEDEKVLRERLPSSFVLFSTPHFQTLGALLKHLQFFITTDGGPSHLSAAVGTRTITLFTGDEKHLKTWAPWGEKHFSLLVERSLPEELAREILSFLQKKAV